MSQVKKQQNKRIVAVQVVAFLAALAASYVSWHLLSKHLTGDFHNALFDLGCNESEEAGAANCERVLQSPYSYFPPKTEDLPAGARTIPVAFLGLVYYSMLAAWFVGVGAPTRPRRFALLIPWVLVGLGLIGSVYFISLMFSDKIDAWCPWCMVTHVLNVIIAVCLLLMWPRRSAEPPKPTTVEDRVAQGVPMIERRPTHRQLIATIGAMYFIAMSMNYMLNSATWRGKALGNERGLADCMRIVNRFKDDVNKMMSMWERQDKIDFKLGPDDPIRHPTPTGPALEVVVFSDLECPHCRRFNTLLEEEIQPMFDGHLKVSFKHFPLSPDCNPYIVTSIHHHACHAAKLAEAARLQGGSDAFWKAHDYLYENYKRLKDVSAAELSEKLGLDRSRLEQDSISDAVAQRILRDATVGKESGVRSTPTIFVNGKMVEPLARQDMAFWDAMANLYWRTIRQPRPEATRRKDIAPTQDSQDQIDAP